MSIWIFVVVLAAYIIVTYLMRSGWLFGSFLKPQTLRELIERKERDGEAALLIDVRTLDEYRRGHIPSAINIPHTDLRDSPPSIARDARIVVYCQTGTRSLFARNALRAHGFTNIENFGRVARWQGNLVQGDEPGQLT